MLESVEKKEVKVSAFTTQYHRRVPALITQIQLSVPNKINNNQIKLEDIFETNALWDTGATNSVITTQTVQALKLEPIGMAKVTHAGGESETNTYYVSIILPNRVAIPKVKVSECKETLGNFGAIIGMDIITLGDFAISNFNKNTTLSYRIPSIQEINFIDKSKPIYVDQKVGRNDKCPCGSGKKYKHCHGINTR